MTHLDIIRAWKDPEYRQSLSEAERAQLPAHPAGLAELADWQMYAIGGGSGDSTVTVNGEICCSSGDACQRPPSPPPGGGPYSWGTVDDVWHCCQGTY